MTATDREAVLTAGLKWYQAGGCILRVATNGSKAPDPGCAGRATSWDDYKIKRPTLNKTLAMLNGAEGIGLVCGAVSGNMEMLELEKAAVDRGWHDELQQLVETVIPGLWERLMGYCERSGGGGLHWIYRVAEDKPVPGNTKLACEPREPTPDDKSKVVTLIETRGEGGFTILAPSNGHTHPEGGKWTLISGGIDHIPTLTAEEHAALHECCQTFDRMPKVQPAEPRSPSAFTSDGDRPGDLWAAVTSWEDILTEAGWKLVYRKGVKEVWRRPGKKYGTSATVNYEGNDRLCVFSSSTEFDPGVSYSKLGAWAQIHHGGNISDAAKELYKLGFKSKQEREGHPLRPFAEQPHPTSSEQNCSPEPQTQPLDLWERPVMQHIFHFARARGVSPYALLASVMARSMAMLPPNYVLPPLVGGVGSLNMFFALVGSSGAGKGTSNAAARDCFDYVQSRPDGAHERPWSDPLAPAEIIDWSSGAPTGPTHVPLHIGDVGSGEGLMHVYAHYETKGDQKGKIVQHRACAMLNVHEVDSLAALGGRQGSTLMPMLREVWSGETLAPQFVDREKRLHLEEQTYRCTMIVGVQPGRAGTLLDDSDGGTPQRFVWLPTADPGASYEILEEPERRKLRIPLPPARQNRILLADEIKAEIRKARVDRLRGETGGEDGHRHFAQEKIATALALLDGHLIEQGITVDDWRLAKALMALSDAVVKEVEVERNRKRAEANKARAEAEADRELVKTIKVSTAALDKCKEAALNKLTKIAPEEWMSASDIRRGVRASHRDVLPEALDILVAENAVEAEKVIHNNQVGLKYRMRR